MDQKFLSNLILFGLKEMNNVHLRFLTFCDSHKDSAKEFEKEKSSFIPVTIEYPNTIPNNPDTVHYLLLSLLSSSSVHCYFRP